MEFSLVITINHPFFLLIDEMEKELEPVVKKAYKGNWNKKINWDPFAKVIVEYREVLEKFCGMYVKKLDSLNDKQREEYFQIIRPSYKFFDRVREKWEEKASTTNRIDKYTGEPLVYKNKLEFLELYSSLIIEHIPTFEDKEPELSEENELEGIEDLTKINEQIRLLYDLGVLQHLQSKYPETIGKSENRLSSLVAKVLKIQGTTAQPYINALLTENKNNKNYPRQSLKIEKILNALK